MQRFFFLDAEMLKAKNNGAQWRSGDAL
jgi:hypothetical protein